MATQYHIAKTLHGAKGFGASSDIDASASLKAKLGADLRPRRVLGACNPKLAHLALSAEDKIGVMLPCSVIVQAVESGSEVAAVNPVAFATTTQR